MSRWASRTDTISITKASQARKNCEISGASRATMGQWINGKAQARITGQASFVNTKRKAGRASLSTGKIQGMFLNRERGASVASTVSTVQWLGLTKYARLAIHSSQFKG